VNRSQVSRSGELVSADMLRLGNKFVILVV
jgi:hypothetical protein